MTGHRSSKKARTVLSWYSKEFAIIVAMKRQVIAFDLDDTLAVTKLPISDEMREILVNLSEKYGYLYHFRQEI